jgi:hypothetical protein
MPDVCLSCKASVIWTTTERGKRDPLGAWWRWMPVDSEPVQGGTILLSHRRVGSPPVALVQGPLEIEQLRAQHERSPQEGPLRLHTSHFATCPDAAAHRKRSGPRSGTPAPQGAHNKQEAR